MKNVTYDKSYAFAIRIVEAYKWLCNEHKEYVLSKQLLRCGTSIGANVSEAIGSISKPEFAAKMSIAYKECLETQYWLKLLKDTGYMEAKSFESIFADADELGKILFSTVRSAKNNVN